MTGSLPEKRLASAGAIALSLGMGIILWFLLTYLIFNTDPNEAGNRLQFLGVFFLALAFNLTPLFHYLEFRGATALNYHGDLLRSARRGGLSALFLSLLAWLRMNNALNLLSASFLFLALILTELLLRVRR